MTDRQAHPGEAQPGLDSLPADEAATRLAELLAIIADDGRTIRLTVDGKPVAALIPPDAADFLDRIEDEHCARVAQAALDESDGETIPWEQVKAELFLDEAGDGAR